MDCRDIGRLAFVDVDRYLHCIDPRVVSRFSSDCVESVIRIRLNVFKDKSTVSFRLSRTDNLALAVQKTQVDTA